MAPTGGDRESDAAPCLSKLTRACRALVPPVAPVRCLLELLMDSLRLSGLVSCLPSRGLGDGPGHTMPQTPA